MREYGRLYNALMANLDGLGLETDDYLPVSLFLSHMQVCLNTGTRDTFDADFDAIVQKALQRDGRPWLCQRGLVIRLDVHQSHTHPAEAPPDRYRLMDLCNVLFEIEVMRAKLDDLPESVTEYQ